MTQTVQSLKTRIMMALDVLPVESLELLSEFVTLLQNRAKQTPPQPNVIKLGGLWAGSPEITAEDIAEARQEMWANFGERVQ